MCIRDSGDRAHEVEARPHHLRLAAQRVGVLHPIALEVRGADPAAGEQAAQRRGHAHLSGLTAQRIDARIERRIAAFQGVNRQSARGAVSYTHLDVYKRQMYPNAAPIGIAQKNTAITRPRRFSGK